MALNTAAYAGIVTKDPDKKIHEGTRINLQAAFNQAAFCIDQGDPSPACRFNISKILNDALTSLDTHLYRNKRPAQYGQGLPTPSTHTLARLALVQAQNGFLTAEEKEKYQQGIKDVARETGLAPELVEASIKDFLLSDGMQELNELALTAINQSNIKSSVVDALYEGKSDKPDNEVKELISRQIDLVAKQLMGKKLTAEEAKEFHENSEKIAKKSGESVEEIQEAFEEITALLQSEIVSQVAIHLQAGLANETYGVYKPNKDGTHTISIPHPENSIEGHLKKEQELHPNIPHALNIHLYTFLTDIHEAEHAKYHEHPSYKHLRPDLQSLAREINSDLAVISFLNSAGPEDKNDFMKVKEYYLQNRHVKSFLGDLQHDTATFIRVFEKTGQQLDLDQFRAEKQNLIHKIEERLGKSTSSAGIQNVMGATQDLLKADAEERARRAQGYPPNDSKLLSDVQKAECESLLEDAQALGYTANPDYAPKEEPVVLFGDYNFQRPLLHYSFRALGILTVPYSFI